MTWPAIYNPERPLTVWIGYQVRKVEVPASRALEDIWQWIRTGRDGLEEQILHLRKMKKEDVSTYRQLKTGLPYFMTGFFEPYRRLEYFHHAVGCVLDIDLKVQDALLRDRLENDPRVLLLFTSPGGDGIKVLCKFDEVCEDVVEYKQFYKAFALQFAREYGIVEEMDLVNCDATRVCFLSYDPGARYNPECEPIRWREFLPSPLISTAKPELPHEEEQPLPESLYREIVQKLGSRPRSRKRMVFIPDGIEQLMPLAESSFVENGLEIKERLPLNYGIKLRFQKGIHTGEINIFYGKRGYSVMTVPKQGVLESLSELGKRLIESIIYGSE